MCDEGWEWWAGVYVPGRSSVLYCHALSVAGIWRQGTLHNFHHCLAWNQPKKTFSLNSPHKSRLTRVAFVGGGGAGELPPSLDLTFPPTGLSENLVGMERGRGWKGEMKGGGDRLPYPPPRTGFCLKYQPSADLHKHRQPIPRESFNGNAK